MQATIRTAVADDQARAMALLPDLADFNVPNGRNPADLWQGDARLLVDYFAGNAPDSHALVATMDNSTVSGIAVFTLRDELISGEPSAHLEVLAVDSDCRRQGIGAALVEATEIAAKNKGAKSLTLHVFSNNTRARSVYVSAGFQEELIRCYKTL